MFFFGLGLRTELGPVEEKKTVSGRPGSRIFSCFSDTEVVCLVRFPLNTVKSSILRHLFKTEPKFPMKNLEM
jgi:hypothetical protein